MAGCLAGYAERFHAAVRPGHHVASPLGAWLLLALVAPAARGEARTRLVEILGAEAEPAAELAARLLGDPHPLVAAAAAAWHRPSTRSAAVSRWLDGLPAVVDTGDVPTQAEADAWARRHTFGLIEQFPLALDPSISVLIASALATRVSWEVPFDLAPAGELGTDSPWASRLTHVLRAPRDPRHLQFIATTGRAGEVAVHVAGARGGLLVASVVAAADVPPGDVLAAGHQIAVAVATGGQLERRSLFDLPLGDGPAWTIAEQPEATNAPDGRDERYSTLLPAWSARSVHDLTRAPDLGFPTAAGVLAELIGPGPFAARQAAVARYSRVGFEAAAVTGLAVAMAYRVPHQGWRREATLRFAHPYAVVAVTTDQRVDPATGSPRRGAWHGVPVFSAWVVDPDNVDVAGDSAPAGR